MITYPLALGDQYTRVVEHGTGPETIVLIHGLGARADRWRRNIGPLADAGYRCVALDLPGHGFASKDGEFDFSCTCPVGVGGAFCKHCVAVGLARLAQGSAGASASSRSVKPAVTMDDVRTYLAGQNKNVLVDMLMEQVNAIASVRKEPVAVG